MPTSDDLKGLMKFLTRVEWRGCFEEVLDDHLGPVLDACDMDFEDLIEILGEVWAMTVWGCAFEDFLTQDFEGEPGNMVDDYVKRRGWKENARSKAYMMALRTSVMSLYEVSNVVPGQSLAARDLIRGGEPITVSEGTATKTLKQWNRIAARVVPVMGKNVLAGGVLPFTPQAAETLFDVLWGTFGKKNAKKLPALKNEELQAAASMFTLSWLYDTLNRAMTRPLLRNNHGDDIVFHDVCFPLASGAIQRDIAARLNSIPGMWQENVKFWNWLEETPGNRDNPKRGNAATLDATMDDGLSVLGNVELTGPFLKLSTNSAARATKGTALIRQALGDLVQTPLTDIRTVEQMTAARPGNHTEKQSSLPPEVIKQGVHEFLDRHYLETLDLPVAMLGNKTPRQAVKTAAGRQKVVEWLKYLENQTVKQPDPTDPMATYNFEWVWKELGVHDLRR
ncbi:hypothetical protein [Mesorhizobium sp. M1406]|uniref:hypothetical protein n=1 Tax=Mesorhizobium sp. M1406 TaxID=2957099 RepID=UPI00333C8C37